MTERPVWFSRAEVEALLDPLALLERLRSAFLDVAAGTVSDPRPLRIDAPEHAANYVGFPCYWPAAGLACVKVLSGAERNPERGLPIIDAVLVVMDAPTGRILAIMDAAAITAARTAAVTALAVAALGPAPGGRVGLIGTGVQMEAHARFLALQGGVDEFIVASAGEDLPRATAAALRVAEASGRPARAGSRRDAAGADVVVLTSVSTAPLFVAEATAPHAIVASVGPFLPHATELDERLVWSASRLVSDRRDRFLDQWRTAADRLGPAYGRVEDLPALLAGPATPSTGVRVFLSDGRAIEDLAAAALVLEAARERGVPGLALP